MDLIIALSPFILTLLFIIISWKWVAKRLFVSMMKILFSDEYEENLFEIVPNLIRIGIVKIVENQLRAEHGDLLFRSMGSSKKWPGLDEITFIPAQTTPFPIDKDEKIDLSTIIGPKAKNPMQIDIPLIIGGMAYGIGLSKEAKISLAQASAQLKTAINSGEGGVLDEEKDAAYKYILQFSKASWAKDESLISTVDMIEIKLGQGAFAGLGDRVPASKISNEAKSNMGLNDDEDAVIHEQFFENQTLADLKELVNSLRETSNGVPIGFKIAAGGRIEEDLDRLIDIGADFIAIDGGQAGTHGAPPILQDDFGIPTLHAVVRADKYLRRRKMKDQVSLVVSGGLYVPGDFLKVLALGADAIYIGSSILFSINHNQFFNSMPWEPPSQTIWSTGSKKDKFNIEKGTHYGYNFLNACVEEMKVGLRAMGKKSSKDLSLDDLVTYDETISKIANLPYSFKE